MRNGSVTGNCESAARKLKLVRNTFLLGSASDLASSERSRARVHYTVFSHSTIHTTQRSICPFLHNHNILSLQTSQVCYIQHCRYIHEFPCRINEQLLSYWTSNAGNHLFAKTLIVSIFFLIQILTKHNHFIHIR